MSRIMDLKLEVVPIPVSDVDAAKAFYTEKVGFDLDHDIRPNDGFEDLDGNGWAVQELKRS